MDTRRDRQRRRQRAFVEHLSRGACRRAHRKVRGRLARSRALRKLDQRGVRHGVSRHRPARARTRHRHPRIGGISRFARRLVARFSWIARVERDVERGQRGRRRVVRDVGDRCCVEDQRQQIIFERYCP